MTMQNRPVRATAALFLLLAPLAAQGSRKLTLADTCYRVMFGAQVEAPAWSADGKAIKLSAWVDARTGEAAPAAAAAATPAVEIKDGDLYLGDKRLTTDGKSKREAYLSADGSKVSFVREHNLYVLDVASGAEWAASKDGNALLLYGYLDWVYQEELYGRGDFRANWWSPDSRKVAFLRLDESKVATFPRIDHSPSSTPRTRRAAVDQRPTLHEDHYPKVGEPNPTVRLGVAHADTKKVVWVDLADYPADCLVVRVAWTPDSRVVFQVQDRIQTWLDVVVADPATGKTTRLFRETSKAWVNILAQPRWLEDGKTFLWLSERTGYKHIYRVAEGEAPVALTKGDWQVREVLAVDAPAGLVWFTGTRDGALGDNLYTAPLAGGGEVVRKTSGDGHHEVKLNADCSLFVDIWSSLSRPPALRVCGKDGAVVREIGKAQVPALRGYAYKAPELIRVPARDGYPLDVALRRPDAAADAKVPVFVDSYFGPDAPTVKDSWPGFDPAPTWHEFLRQQGFLVVQVNVRTASGRGQKDTELCYKNFGAVELRDLCDVVDHVCAKHGGDPARVGLTGWSYGGFMTAYAMAHSDRFKLGIAGGGVYDWRLYDTIYTERYMALPEENKEGYATSSVIGNAHRLHGHLVIVHGVMDDNVHLQNAMELVHALQLAGKEFDLMLYPKMMHGPNTIQQVIHKRKQEWTWIRRHLLD